MGTRLLYAVCVWTPICFAAAGPSLYFSQEFPLIGRVACIAIWVLVYALLTARTAFAVQWGRRSFRVAIVIAYGLRIAVSAAAIVVPLIALGDLYCGLISVMLVQQFLPTPLTHSAIMDDHPHQWLEAMKVLSTILITLIQGLLLSIANFILLMVVWAICRLTIKDATPAQRGFEVVSVVSGNDAAAG